MTKTIVVGDIHGHVGSVEAALAEPHNVVFVGDYLDAFHQSVENQIRCLTLVLDAIEDEPDRVVGLFGNHERSYIDRHMQCSGYNPVTQGHVTHLMDRMTANLKHYHWVGEYLISHAGIDRHLLDGLGLTAQEYLDAGDFDQIGRLRGGYAPAGGLYWNDFNGEMEPVPNLKQVVGHSYSKGLYLEDGVRLKDRNGGQTWCVDNLGRVQEVLMIDGDRAYPYLLSSGEGSDICEQFDCTNAAQELHTCPYAAEIGGDDETLCNCCDGCADHCCDDI